MKRSIHVLGNNTNGCLYHFHPDIVDAVGSFLQEHMLVLQEQKQVKYI